MRALATLLLVTAAGCGAGDIAGTVGGGYSPTGLPGAPGSNKQLGYLDTGLADGWSYPFGAKFFGQGEACRTTGACGFGGLTNTGYATFASGGGTILYVSTKLFTDSDPGGGASKTYNVGTSAIQRDGFALTTANAGKKLRLSFEYAFLLGRDVPDDSAIVQLIPGTGTPVRVFGLRRADVGASVPQRAGDCGKSGFGSVPSQYEGASEVTPFTRCTDWTSYTFDVSAYRGQTVALRFINREATTNFAKGNTFLVRKVEIQEEQ